MLDWPIPLGPDEGSYGWDEQPKITRVAFGDGYSQRAGNLLSNNLRKWSLTWSNIDVSTKEAMRSFLLSAGGYQSFLWTPPGEPQPVVVKAPSWTVRRVGGGYWVVSVVFQQLAEAAAARRDALLREGGSYLLREDGSRILLEGALPISDALLREDGSYLLREDGSFVLLEGV